jgi:hypothetical protein
MAYQTSDIANIHSTSSDAKLLLSNPTETWALKNNFVDNTFILGNQTLPNILNVDPTTGAVNLVDTIRSTQSKLKSNTTFSTNLLSSLGMVADYDIRFPPTPPTADQVLLFDGVNYVWEPIFSSLASDGTGVSLVSNGVAPGFVIHSLLGTGGTTVTQVGDHVEISVGPPITTNSPAFIANHIPALTDYNTVPYTPVKWDDISQTSTDVTYNSITDEFTTVTTGDYMISFAFFSGTFDASYLAAMRNETTLVNYVQDLSYTTAWATQNNYTLRNGDPITSYTWNDKVGSKASFTTIVHLIAADVFTFGIEPDPTNPGVITDGVLEVGIDDRPLTNCTIERLL